jgi:hypothetical protein
LNRQLFRGPFEGGSLQTGEVECLVGGSGSRSFKWLRCPIKQLEHGMIYCRKRWGMFWRSSSPARRGPLEERRSRVLFHGRVRAVDLNSEDWVLGACTSETWIYGIPKYMGRGPLYYCTVLSTYTSYNIVDEPPCHAL